MTSAAATSSVQTSVTINRVLPAEGRDNVAQWELHVRWPWTPAANQYGDKVWVNQAGFPNLNAATKGYFPSCEVVKGTLKSKQDGTKHDGTQNWMWNWRILSLDAGAGPDEPHDSEFNVEPRPHQPLQQAPEMTALPDHPSKRRSIERQSALVQAVQLGIAQVITFDQLLPAAEKFYGFISADPAVEPEAIP